MESSDTPIGEIAVQEALEDLLKSSAAVRVTILREVGVANFCDESSCVFIDANRSVTEPDGESDLVAEWANPSGARLRLLIELKLTAGFMRRQGARYVERARRAMRNAPHLTVRSVLVAPAAYLASANPEAGKFDVRISLESLLERDSVNLSVAQPIEAALRRLAAGKPLGAKGLFPELHRAVNAECERRGNGLRVLNKPTDWVTLKGDAWPVGVNLNYRIRSGVAEIRVLASYKGPRDTLTVVNDARVQAATSGGEVFLKNKSLHVSPDAKRGTPSSADVAAIVTAMEALQSWWFGKKGNLASPRCCQ